jgi:ribosomal protein L35
MPKLKTKSGAKKRFKITGTGKVMYADTNRHGSPHGRAVQRGACHSRDRGVTQSSRSLLWP